MAAHPSLPRLALIGRPNVGKSTLFNRLSGTRRALVAPVAGVTRDRREQDVRRDGFAFTLVDTGGMGFTGHAELEPEVETQVAHAVDAADAVWLVLDARAGLNPYDAELYRLLLKRGKPLLVVINKAEDMAMASLGDFFRLGSAQIHPLSALHGRGVREALQATALLVPALRAAVAEEGASPAGAADGEPEALAPLEAGATPAAAQEAPLRDDHAVRVAFVGRPNVGKSSLINRILGSERFIVSAIAGTTREALEVSFTWEERPYLLVDTAGIRRKARTKEYLEKLSVVNALTTLEHTDVAVLVVDAADGAADQDARIAGHILERRRGLVVALNKWDAVPETARLQAEEAIRETLRFVEFAAFVRVSARTGDGLPLLFKEIRAAYQQFTRQVQTADLNRVLRMTAERTSPPPRGRSPSRIFYGAQYRTAPPSFRIFTNHPEQIRDSYTRFMEHRLRYHFGLKGTPVVIDWRGRKDEPADSHSRRGGRPARPAQEAPRPHRKARQAAAQGAAPARDRRPAQGRSAQGRPDQSRPAQTRPGQARSGQARSGQARRAQTRPAAARPAAARTGRGRPVQGRTAGPRRKARPRGRRA